MPNWCSNFLNIEGDYNELKKFKDENNSEEKELDFEKSVPFPNGQYDRDFAITEWGTKWNADVCYTDFIDNDSQETKDKQNNECKLYYDFTTAWSPPLSWLRKIAKKYINLNFSLEYFEGGCDFAGEVLYEEGDLKLYEEFTYSEYMYKKNKFEINNYVIDALMNKDRIKKLDDLKELKENTLNSYYGNNNQYLREIIENINQDFDIIDEIAIKNIVLTHIDDIINKRIEENINIINNYEKYIPIGINDDVKEIIKTNLIY